MLHRLAVNLKMEALLFQLSVFNLFNKILNDPAAAAYTVRMWLWKIKHPRVRSSKLMYTVVQWFPTWGPLKNVDLKWIRIIVVGWARARRFGGLQEKSQPLLLSSSQELATFAKYVLNRFFALAAQNDKAYVELLFWKNVGSVREMTEGYTKDGLVLSVFYISKVYLTFCILK